MFFSCERKNLSEENTYRIISELIGHYTHELVHLPPPPPEGYRYTLKDSLHDYKIFYDRSTKKKNIVIRKKMVLRENDIRLMLEFDSNLSDELFFFDKKPYLIDINKISKKDRDTIFYYNNKYTKEEINEKIDVLFSFSKIVFNKKQNKALVVVGVSMGHLNGFSSLLYLEKKHYHWKIVCKKMLSIS